MDNNNTSSANDLLRDFVNGLVQRSRPMAESFRDSVEDFPSFQEYIQEHGTKTVNPYKGTPFEAQYVNILDHYHRLIAEAEINKAWYEYLGLSRYTEQLVAQYKTDMYAELRDLETTYRNYELSLPENVVELQDRAGLNSDLIGLQYSGFSSGSGGSGSSARSTPRPSSNPASEALMMGLSMIGAVNDFATMKLPSLLSSIGQIRGISLDNDIKRQQVLTGKFNQYAVENEYLREWALNQFSDIDPSTDDGRDFFASMARDTIDEWRELRHLPAFEDDERAWSYLLSYVGSDNFVLDRQAIKNGTLNLSRENAFLSETYGSDFSSMTEYFKELAPLVRDLEKLTARYNLNQASYDFNTVSDNVTSKIDTDGSLSFVSEVSESLDPESAVQAVNAGNERSYYQNQFESDVKEIMQKHTSKWSEKAESGEWWSWIYDLLIMALPQFIQGLSSGSISLFRGGNTINNSSVSNDYGVTNDYGTKDIVSNRYFNGSSE